MWSKNKKRPDSQEEKHVQRVKLMPCGCCEEGGGYSAPSEFHELEQGMWWTGIPACPTCHRHEKYGLHGQQLAWKLRKKSPLSVLNDTIRKLMTGQA